MRRLTGGFALGTVALIGMLGCSEAKPAPSADTISQRQRDSILGASQLPGAQGVRGALRSSDSSSARRAREDAAANDSP